MTYSRAAIIRGTHCGEPCPDALSGHLGALHCKLETNRDGLHDGDHRATHKVLRVGTIKISWSNKNKPKRQPPVIVLPTPTADHVNPQRGKIV